MASAISCDFVFVCRSTTSLEGGRFGDECLTTVLSIGLSTSLATESGAAGSGLQQGRGRLVEPGGLGLGMVWR